MRVRLTPQNYFRRNLMAKPKKEKTPAPPPIVRLRGPHGMVVYPLMVQQPDGSWEVSEPEAVKRLLQTNPNKLK
jgi:hypothetical protein